MGANDTYDTSVFQSAFLKSYRFEIGSVRYPQTDVACNTTENSVELMKAWGKLGDYSHQQAFAKKHVQNHEDDRDGSTLQKSTLSAFTIGYDFEAFQRVALESGINTADRYRLTLFASDRPRPPKQLGLTSTFSPTLSSTLISTELLLSLSKQLNNINF